MIDYSKQFLDFYTTGIARLKEELNAYSSEANIWKTDGKVSNSTGTLILHLTGSINHFFGATLGHTGFARERDLEFSIRDIPRAEMIAELDKASAMLTTLFAKLTNEDLEKTYPLKKNDKDESTAHFMIHLYGHLYYHLGQINYHRRLLDE